MIVDLSRAWRASPLSRRFASRSAGPPRQRPRTAGFGDFFQHLFGGQPPKPPDAAAPATQPQHKARLRAGDDDARAGNARRRAGAGDLLHRRPRRQSRHSRRRRPDRGLRRQAGNRVRRQVARRLRPGAGRLLRLAEVGARSRRPARTTSISSSSCSASTTASRCTTARTRCDPLSDRWRRLYGQRVEALLAPFAAAHIPVAWVGLPPMRADRIQRRGGQVQRDLQGAREKRGGQVHRHLGRFRRPERPIRRLRARTSKARTSSCAPPTASCSPRPAGARSRISSRPRSGASSTRTGRRAEIADPAARHRAGRRRHQRADPPRNGRARGARQRRIADAARTAQAVGGADPVADGAADFAGRGAGGARSGAGRRAASGRARAPARRAGRSAHRPRRRFFLAAALNRIAAAARRPRAVLVRAHGPVLGDAPGERPASRRAYRNWGPRARRRGGAV